MLFLGGPQNKAARAQRDMIVHKFGRTTRRHSADLLGREGVSGVAVEQEEDGFVLSVLLDRDDPELQAGLPERIEGHPVKYRVTGRFHRQGTE